MTLSVVDSLGAVPVAGAAGAAESADPAAPPELPPALPPVPDILPSLSLSSHQTLTQSSSPIQMDLNFFFSAQLFFPSPSCFCGEISKPTDVLVEDGRYGCRHLL